MPTRPEHESWAAYVDESGNTGSNVFDPTAPYFYTGTLLAPLEFEEVAKLQVAKCLSELASKFPNQKIHELHANELGIRRINEIAGRITSLIGRLNVRFVFGRIDKRHLVALKYVDTVIDSGTNSGANPMWYNERPLRLVLATVISELMDDDDLVEWWSVFGSGDCSRFRKLTFRIDFRASRGISDPRLRKVVLQTLRWAACMPEQVLASLRGDGDSPNIPAFAAVLRDVDQLLQRHNARIGLFVHDRQDQFGNTLKNVYEMLSKVRPSSHVLARAIDLFETDGFDSPFIQSTGTMHAGLQIVDVALWLIKRSREGKSVDAPNCRRLIKAIERRSVFTEFSRQQLVNSATMSILALQSLPLPTGDDLVRAKHLRDEVDSNMRQRMRSEVAKGPVR